MTIFCCLDPFLSSAKTHYNATPKIHFSPQDKEIFLLMYVRIFSDHPRTKYHELHDTESVSYHFKCFHTINGSDFEQIIWFLCVTHFKGPVIHTFMLKYGEALFKYHR